MKTGNPLTIKFGVGINYGATTMKYLVTPDEIKDYQILNDILPLPLNVTPAE